jgi:hypothetical protein
MKRLWSGLVPLHLLRQAAAMLARSAEFPPNAAGWEAPQIALIDVQWSGQENSGFKSW